MKIHSPAKQFVLSTAIAASLSALSQAEPEYAWKNLDSSIFGVALHYDANLENPWGVAPGEDGKTVWVANEATGTVTRYELNGKPFEIKTGATATAALDPEVVQVPSASGTGTGSPTGLVFNHAAFGANKSTEFILPGTSNPSHWLAVTEDGCVVGFNIAVTTTSATPNAIIGTTVPGAFFTGCTLAFTGLTPANQGHRLYAADFGNGVVDVFNSDFSRATLGTGAFIDPNPVTGFKPYNIKRYATKDPVTGKTLRVILVAYAQDSGTNHLPVVAEGEGYVNVFKTDGTFLTRLVSPSTTVTSANINAPWGMAIYRKNAIQAHDELLVANHGNGTIVRYSLAGVFDFTSEPAAQTAPIGALERGDGEGPLRFSQLRAIHFGQRPGSALSFAADEDELNDGDGTLYFGADIAFDERGLFGRILPAP